MFQSDDKLESEEFKPILAMFMSVLASKALQRYTASALHTASYARDGVGEGISNGILKGMLA